MQLWRALRVTAGRAGNQKWEGVEPPFVGRERELRLVEELFHASADERKAHLVSVVGMAGIGKSRLAWELYKYGDGLARTVRWHQGRCLAYGEGVTYWALAEMLRERAGIAEGEDPESARAKLQVALDLHVEDSDERAWIEPRLRHLLALDEPDAGEQPDLFAGWRLFFERIAERDPVVLVFEDMQWADRPLLEFVDYLLEWSRNHPIFVLALARPELAERHPAWAVAKRNSTSLTLEPLSSVAMEKLLAGYVPGLPEELREQILGASEGVPLYAVETIRMLLDQGLVEKDGDAYRVTGPIDSLEVPETLHALIAARLDGLASAERRLVQQAAVLGKTFTKTALAAVANGAEPELDRLLESVVRKEILSLQADPRSPERGQYGFLQDLLRQVAYETLPRKERKTRHLAAAQYLEQEWLEGDQEVVEIIASHYLSALELDPRAPDAADITANALATLTRAGARAASLAASESAQRYFERALELADDAATEAKLHEQAGRMAMRGGRTAAARAHFEQSIALFEAVAHPLAAVRVSAKLGELTWTQEGNIEQAVADMERSFGVLVSEERSVELAMLAAQLSRVLFFSGRPGEAMVRNELALEIAEALQLPEVLSHALNTKSLILGTLGRHEEGNILLRHALDVALAHDLSEAAGRAYNNLTAESDTLGRYREGLDYSRANTELARRTGDRGAVFAAEGWIVSLLVTVGEWDEALALDEEHEREAEADLREARRWELLSPLPVFLARGELGEVHQRMDVAREWVDPNDVQDKAGYRTLEAHILLVEGHLAEALAAAEEALASWEELGMRHVGMRQAFEAALEAACALRDDTKMDELLAIIELTPPGHLAPYVRALGARFAAQRAARQGDPTTASAGFLAAADLLRELERPFEVGVVQLENAEWLAAAGETSKATTPAGEAREIFERLRAAPWLERLDRVRAVAAEEVLVE